MKFCSISSALVISGGPFTLIKGSIYVYPIDYLLFNQCEVHLSGGDSDKADGLQFIWPYFYWSIIHCKDIRNNYSSEFIWKFFPLEWHE